MFHECGRVVFWHLYAMAWVERAEGKAHCGQDVGLIYPLSGHRFWSLPGEVLTPLQPPLDVDTELLLRRASSTAAGLVMVEIIDRRFWPVVLYGVTLAAAARRSAWVTVLGM